MRLDEGIVDGNDLEVITLSGVAEDDTANTTETVDTDLNWGHDVILSRL